jgi:catechol 2,3-dioxygenase-like lactoylglutathione lyase family enzyme
MLKLGHTSFYVKNLDKAMEFFGHLGFSEVRRVDVPHLKTVLCFIEDGSGGTIELMYVGDRCDPKECIPSAFGYAHLGLETDDIEGEARRLKGVGIHFKDPIRQVPDGPKIGFIEGPDNIVVEVVEYPRGN